MLEFSVQDFDKGIDAVYQDKIFDKYFQVPGSNKNATGLELAIAKEFIVGQNDKIEKMSALGKGTTFYFQIPII
jgi:NtrC-family two-component system sensor histidine kinase KinB